MRNIHKLQEVILQKQKIEKKLENSVNKLLNSL
jgi:hypothetical protein